jgi:hypothetical protein
VSTVSDSPTHRAPLPRQTQAAVDTAARTVIARNGLATIADIATEAGRSTASFYTVATPKMLSSASGRCGSATRAASGRLPGMACRYGSEATRPQLHTGSPTNIG